MTETAGSPASPTYAARLDVEYPEELERVTSAFRILFVIPILIILVLISGSGGETVAESGERVRSTGWGVSAGLAVATALMIAVRERYPRWWFDFALELTRFSARVGAYAALLTDRYPSTTDEQSVHVELDYPDVERDLNRWMPLVKWFLAIPHYVVLAVLAVGALFAVVAAWFAILFTGRYPRALFEYVVGVGRWALRVGAYAFLLLTDDYPPFSLRP